MEEQLVPDYKGFSNMVEIAIDKVENPDGLKSYSYETFCNILEFQMYKFGLSDYQGDNIEDPNKGFALAVVSIIEGLYGDEKPSKEKCKEAFNGIKDLMDVYGINEPIEDFNRKAM